MTEKYLWMYCRCVVKHGPFAFRSNYLDKLTSRYTRLMTFLLMFYLINQSPVEVQFPFADHVMFYLCQFKYVYAYCKKKISLNYSLNDFSFTFKKTSYTLTGCLLETNKTYISRKWDHVNSWVLKREELISDRIDHRFIQQLALSVHSKAPTTGPD